MFLHNCIEQLMTLLFMYIYLNIKRTLILYKHLCDEGWKNCIILYITFLVHRLMDPSVSGLCLM